MAVPARGTSGVMRDRRWRRKYRGRLAHRGMEVPRMCQHGQAGPAREFVHFEARNSFPSARIVAKRLSVPVKYVRFCVNDVSFCRKCPFLGRATCHLFVCFHIHNGFVRIKKEFFFLEPSRATMQPPLRRINCLEFSASVWAFILSSR